MSIRKTLFALAIVSTFTITFAFAQTTTTKRKTHSQPKPAASPTAPTTSRSRRVDPATENQEVKTEATASNATPEPSPVNSPSPAESPTPAQASAGKKQTGKTPEVAAETASETPAETAKDPIMQLRDEIDAAATPQDRIRLQLKLAEELAGNGKKTEAVAELKAITESDAFDPQGFYNAGNALARLGDTEEAINAYRKAIEQRKGSYSRAHNNLGVVLMRVGRWDQAQDAFLSALRVENFRYAEASYNLGRLYASQGQLDLAVREWRRAVAVDPEHAAAAQALARSGNEGRITVEPVPARDNRVGRNSTAPPVGERQPSKTSAPRLSAKPLTLDPTSFGYLQKARNASDRGNKTEAIDNYQRVIARENGYFAPANLELSFVLIGLKRNDEAMATLREVVNREGSKYPVGYYHLARIYEVKGELKLAEEAFAQAVAAYGSKNSQFLLDLSRVREKLGNFQGALEAMEQYVTLVKKDGQDIAWSEERVAVLRQKASAPK